MPGLVAVDLAQAVRRAVIGEPGRGSGGTDVDRVPRHVRRRVRRCDPPRRCMFGSVLGNRLTKKLVLVLPRTPAAVDEELDAVVSGVRGSSLQGTEQIRI